MTNSLAIYDFDTTQKTAVALFKSGYFTDVKSQEQAIVKILAGQELGLPAFASMAGIHIIQGKPVLGANVIATLVKNSGRYNYYIRTCTNDNCIIDWYEGGKLQGDSAFSIVDAKLAGLTGKDNWNKYPSDMLFARAISRGARRYAPGIFGGSPVYTPDELGVDTDEEGYISQPTITVIEPTLSDAIKAEGGVEKPEVVIELSHDWQSMDTGELAGHINAYLKRLKTNPSDEDTLKKLNEAKMALEAKTGKAKK